MKNSKKIPVMLTPEELKILKKVIARERNPEPNINDKSTWKYGIHPELFCDKCKKPCVTTPALKRAGVKIEQCHCIE